MAQHIEVVVIGGGYAGVMAANRLTKHDGVAVTLINPRARFVHRVRLHQWVGGTGNRGARRGGAVGRGPGRAGASRRGRAAAR
ncbi:FAD-dependent oxidoreductase, partial [Streptomyces sp. NPDC001274]